MSDIFFRNDPFLEKIDISENSRTFFSELEKEFGFPVFDEVLIIRKEEDHYRPTYYHDRVAGAVLVNIDEYQKKLMKNIDFFIERVIKKHALGSGEGVFNLNQHGELFDVMIRMSEYFVCFNNSEESIKTMREKGVASEQVLIGKIRKFCTLFPG